MRAILKELRQFLRNDELWAVEPLTAAEKRACWESARAIPKGTRVPVGPGDCEDAGHLAALYYASFRCETEEEALDVIRHLPPELASPLRRWRKLDRQLVRLWSTCRNVGEVARLLKTDPDYVLYRARLLRDRGFELDGF